MKKIWTVAIALCALMLFFLVLPNQAQAASVSDLTFTLNEDQVSYSVTKCKTSASGKLEIPATYNDLPVTAIGASAFEGCSKLTEVTLSNNVQTIGKRAFYDCKKLTGMVFPEGVLSIGESAFQKCAALTEIVIPDSMESIGNAAFRQCTAVTSVTIGSGVKSIGSFAFYYCTKLTSITIPDNVESLGASAFYCCTALTDVTVGDGVKTIGNSAFAYCTQLVSVTLGDNITSIDGFAFAGNNRMKMIIMPKTVTLIVEDAFLGCANLKKVYFTGDQAAWNGIEIQLGNENLQDAKLVVNYNGEELRDYIIVFQNWNGDVLATQTYEFGDTVIPPADPTRESDGTNRYVFAGWDKDVTDCTGDATYTATYVTAEAGCVVVFKDWDGTVLSTNTYHYGDKVVAPSDPTKAADNTYTYTFAGWDKEVVDCAGDATYTAVYTPTYIEYTVTFKDWDGTVLSTNTYHYGDKVVAPSDPTKAADNTYTYTFAGWDKDVADCAGDAIYTATYSSAYIEYAVVFLNWDGTVLSAKNYHYGDKVVAPSDPTRKSDGTNTYTFAGWDKEVVDCAGAVAYTATYTTASLAIPGDVDGDKAVTRNDVVSLLLHVTMPNRFPLNAEADFDGDGAVTRNDVIRLLLHVTMPNRFPLMAETTVTTIRSKEEL